MDGSVFNPNSPPLVSVAVEPNTLPPPEVAVVLPNIFRAEGVDDGVPNTEPAAGGVETAGEPNILAAVGGLAAGSPKIDAAVGAAPEGLPNNPPEL